MSRDALIVGINSYQHLPSLNAPAQDAEAIAQKLQMYGDFRVSRLPEVVVGQEPNAAPHTKVGVKTPVSLRELEAALVRLFKPKGSNIPQTAVFYFSGHGLQKEAGIQEGYLALSDSCPDLGFYGLSLFWLRRLLQESPVRQRIIWLDCCHSGEFLNFLEADPGARPGTDRLFMAASREYEAAYESLNSSYSVFTQALLEGLEPCNTETQIVTNYALTNWVSNALKTEIQQPLFENSGSEIILTRCTGSPKVSQPTASAAICPYRGLEFFDEAHAEYFFGRNDLTDQLIDRLRTGRFVAVVGASGSGKSSLVRAGLIHELRQGHKFSGSDRWEIKVITPTERPMKSLAAAFVDPQATGLDRAEQLRRAEEFLKEGGSGLAQLAQAAAIARQQTLGHNHSSPRLVLVIDQFEEVFTLCPSDSKAEQERHRFFNCLMGALREAGEVFSIVIVLRADFFGKCSLYNGLAQQIEENLVTVTPLNYEQIKATIVRPAQKVGLVCEPNLVYTMLLDVVGAPGELPLLQYTLTELWQQRQEGTNGEPSRLTLDAYTQLGGIRGTLQKRATEIFYSLTPDEQRVAQRIFLALTQLGEGTEDTRRRILKSELISPSLPVELIDRVLEKLVTAKLVVTNRIYASVSSAGAPSCIITRLQPSKTTTNVSTTLRLAQKIYDQAMLACNPLDLDERASDYYLSEFSTTTSHRWQALDTLSAHTLVQETIDVAHEALIRNWPLLRTWLDENREMLRRQRRLEQAAREWDQAGQPTEADYLLKGSRLLDAEDYLKNYSEELSALAQQYITLSQEESRKAHKESRILQLGVPCALLLALSVSFNQYRASMRNQVEKDYQIQVATSRQRAAIAQAILQESDSDPMAALLISRLAAEQGKHTYEAQASLRSALQKLQLQIELAGHQGAVKQMVFSPDQNRMATAGADGTIRIWSLPGQTVERVLSLSTAAESDAVTSAEPSAPSAVGSSPITDLAFSPDGQQLAAIAQGEQKVRLWSVESGSLQGELAGFRQDVLHLAFSPSNHWIAAASADKSVKVWHAKTKQLQANIRFNSAINNIQFSPDGQLLLIAGADGKVMLYHLANKRANQMFMHSVAVNQATFSPSGRWVATACDDGKARLWNVTTGRLHETLQQRVGNQPMIQVLFSPDEQFVAAAGFSHQVWLWRIPSGQLWTTLERADSSLQGVRYAGPEPIAFSPDGQFILTASHNQTDNPEGTYVSYLWETYTGRKVGVLRGHRGAIEAAQFSPNGTYVATASSDGNIRLWSTQAGGELPTLTMPGGVIQWAAFLNPETPTKVSPGDRPQTQDEAELAQPKDKDFAASPFTLTQVSQSALQSETQQPKQVWGQFRHLLNRQALQSNSQPTQQIQPLPSASAATMITISLNGAFQFWSVPPGRSTSQVLNLDLRSTAESTGLSTPPTPSTSSQPSGELIHSHSSHTSSPPVVLTAVAVNSQGELMAVADATGEVKILQVQQSSKLQMLYQFRPTRSQNPPPADQQATPRPLMIRQFAFSTDGTKLLGIGDDWTVRLWDLTTGKQIQALSGHKATIEQAHFSRDGKQVVTASWDRTARIWETATGKTLRVIYHQDVVSSAKFSPDGEYVVTASWDGVGRVSDTATGTLRVALAGHRGAVLDAEFSPDGRSLVTASADGTARLWDAKTGTEKAQLRAGGMTSDFSSVHRAFFSPDGRYVATQAEDGKVHLWAADWQTLTDLARDRTQRQLTAEECIQYLHLPPDVCPTLALNSATNVAVNQAAARSAP